MNLSKTDEAHIKLTTPATTSLKKPSSEDENELEKQIMPAEKKARESEPPAALPFVQSIALTQNVTAYNPAIPDDEEENDEVLKSMRGDAIGSTLYSSRYVISTLLKLRDIRDPLENDESFEKDLEALWDMTIEKDVVLLLLQFDVFEIFMQCMLKYSNDGRLIEILVGIMGNMCSVADVAMEELCKIQSAIDVLLQLIANDDSGVLIQLMRLYTNAFSKESSAYIWSKRIVQSNNFKDCFCFILMNSCNTSLLLHSFEALNAILAKSAIMALNEENASGGDHQDQVATTENKNSLRYFLDVKLSEAIKQAFLTFHAKETVYTTSRCGDVGEDNNSDEEVEEDFNESISESVQKAFIMFLNIEEIIFNYAFDDIFNEKTETELKSCLLVIISTISTPLFVLPNNFDYLLNVLEIFKEFFYANATLHDENMASYVANMWEILRKLKLKQINRGVGFAGNSSNGFDDDAEQNDSEILDDTNNESLNKIFQLTRNVLKIMLQKYDAVTLEVILRRLSPLSAFKLLEAYGVALSSEYIEELHITSLHCEQLQSALNA